MNSQRNSDDAIRRWLNSLPEHAPERAMLDTIQQVRLIEQPRMIVLRLPLPLAAAIAGLALLVGSLALATRLGPLEPGASPSPTGSTGACSIEIAVAGRSPILVGRGFPPDTDVVLEIDRADGTHITIDGIERPELHTDGDGRFGLNLQPYPNDIGRNVITAVAGCSATVESVVSADDLPPPCPDPAIRRTDLMDSAGYRAAVAADRPVHWWHLDERSGPIAADSAGDAAGTWVGDVASIAGDGAAGAVYLNGDGSFIELSDLTFGDFTVEAWVHLCDVVDNSDALVGNSQEPPNINFHNGRIRLFTGEDDVVMAATAATLGRWQHWAVTRDSTGTRIYVDGRLDATGAVWEGPMIVDAIGRGDAGFLQALIDEVAIYDRALSEERLTAHAQSR